MAPQCFDISLWQLVSALLVGGRTLLVEQDLILDVARFVDTVAAGRVNVLQVVPSYLEVVLTYLEQHPRELPDLRCVSATGEALKAELAAALVRGPARDHAGQRLRADRDLGRHEPRGDDLRPAGDRMPLGPAIRTSRVYVVDEQPGAGAARRSRPDRLLRGVRRPRLRQRPGAHRRGVPPRPAPAGRAALQGRRLRPLAARTASWSSSAAATPRSRSPGSASRSARSTTPCRACPACATAPWSSRSGRTAASTWWRSTPGRGRSTSTCCASGWAHTAALHGPGPLPMARGAAADRQRQDRHQGADRPRGRAGHRRAPRTARRRARHSDRAAARRRVGGGARHTARTRSAATTTSSTAAVPRCRRCSWRSPSTASCRTRTSLATPSSPTSPR